MSGALKTIREVAEFQLCCGCGACAYLSPDEVRMVDTLEYGRRPLFTVAAPCDRRSAEALAACPGARLEHRFDRDDPALIRELLAGWGPVREVWEGYAADPEIRFAGSSGGAASALALFCLERLGFHGVLHIAARPDAPYLNHTVLSTTRAEILARTGSRYAPASPCDGLRLIEEAAGPCVFIGKPCDVAGAHRAARCRPRLAEKLGLTIAIFCAGTPTTRATFALLRRLGIDDPARVRSLQYRGNGWPGRFVVRFVNAANTLEERSLTYEESWGRLTNDKQWRCHLCPDHTGEFADVAVGDPWYRAPTTGEVGRSLILSRTASGARAVQAAAATGALRLLAVPAVRLPESQPNLLKARGAVWGRLLALRLLGVPTTSFRGLAMARYWLGAIGWRERARSLLGSVVRCGRRRLRERHIVTEYVPVRPAAAGAGAGVGGGVSRPRRNEIGEPVSGQGRA